MTEAERVAKVGSLLMEIRALAADRFHDGIAREVNGHLDAVMQVFISKGEELP